MRYQRSMAVNCSAESRIKLTLTFVVFLSCGYVGNALALFTYPQVGVRRSCDEADRAHNWALTPAGLAGTAPT
jgi:hypothetical protein